MPCRNTGGSEDVAPQFLTSALDGVVSFTPQLLYPHEDSGTHSTGGWMGLRAGLGRCEEETKFYLEWELNPVRSAHSPVAIPTIIFK
jgi:hypothetical protein